MKVSEIKELISLVDKSGLTEFEYQTSDGEKLTLRKLAVGTQGLGAPAVNQATHSAAAPAPAEGAAEAVEQVDGLLPGQFTIVSPMVGTFYRAPEPGAKPFVEVGDIVEPGQTVCIIEAMKLMNEIEAERRGRVIRILVDNEEPVEYGQPLFVLQDV